MPESFCYWPTCLFGTWHSWLGGGGGGGVISELINDTSVGYVNTFQLHDLRSARVLPWDSWDSSWEEYRSWDESRDLSPLHRGQSKPRATKTKEVCVCFTHSPE